MSRNKDYQRMLNSKRWKALRMWKLCHNPLCELCRAEGYVRSAVDVHHITPVESAKTLQEMERLCFDAGNLQSLCIPHHKAVHMALRSQTKEGHQAAAQTALERWKEKHKPKGNGNEDGTIPGTTGEEDNT